MVNGSKEPIIHWLFLKWVETRIRDAQRFLDSLDTSEDQELARLVDEIETHLGYALEPTLIALENRGENEGEADEELLDDDDLDEEELDQ